jgi:hypothetical protein
MPEENATSIEFWGPTFSVDLSVSDMATVASDLYWKKCRGTDIVRQYNPECACTTST